VATQPLLAESGIDERLLGYPAAAMPLQEDSVARVRAQVAALLPESGLTIDRLAGSLGLSTRTLQRQLAKRGISLTEVIAAARMKKATEWLRRSDKPVLGIALDTGYTDASNFSRAFRRLNGISPRTCRETVQKTWV
jgi:AraC-like DNA-binding protein